MTDRPHDRAAHQARITDARSGLPVHPDPQHEVEQFAQIVAWQTTVQILDRVLDHLDEDGLGLVLHLLGDPDVQLLRATPRTRAGYEQLVERVRARMLDDDGGRG